VRFGSLGLLGVMVVLFAFGAGWNTAEADDANTLELAVKATYLYKFQPFVTWPAQAFPSPDAPFTLCIVGNRPFGPLLERVVDGQRAGGRNVAVLRLTTVSPDDHCQILYVGAGDAVTVKQLAAPVAGMPVLTVTDSIGDSGAKGMINFVVVDNRVRFEIDDAAAKQSGLTISSKLLSLAVSVRPGP
jgi:hypothetical protein